LSIRLQVRPSLSSSELQDYCLLVKQVLRLEQQDFNICFVDDPSMSELNATYRGKPRPTDVLSFPWRSDDKIGRSGVETYGGAARQNGISGGVSTEFEGFLGDIVISVPAARRNAANEGHSTATEIRMLILHGVLHLLGYDHEADQGEMTAKELALRRELNILGKTRGEKIPKSRAVGSNRVGRRNRRYRS
jgi:probable rRNA maturation factor